MFASLLKTTFFSFFKSSRLNRKLVIKPNKKPQVQFKRWGIVRGDIVMVRSGVDKKKVGKVIKVLRKTNQVVVRGVNIKEKSKKKSEEDPKVVKIKRESPVHVSNVGLYDPSVKKAVRIFYAYHPQTNEKLRISKKSGRVLKKPNFSMKLRRQKRAKYHKLGTKDTQMKLVQEVTYKGEDFQAIKRQFQQFIADKEAREKKLVFSE